MRGREESKFFYVILETRRQQIFRGGSIREKYRRLSFYFSAYICEFFDLFTGRIPIFEN